MINFNTYVHKTPWLVQYVLGMIVPSMNSAVYIRDVILLSMPSVYALEFLC